MQVFGPLIDRFRDVRIERERLARDYTTVRQAADRRLDLDNVRVVLFDLLASESVRQIFASITIRPSMITPFTFSPIVESYQKEFETYIGRRYSLGLCKSFYHKFTKVMEHTLQRVDACTDVLQKYNLNTRIYFVPLFIVSPTEYDEFVHTLANISQSYEEGSTTENELTEKLIEMIFNELKSLDNERVSLLSHLRNRITEIEKIMNFYAWREVCHLGLIRADLIQLRLILRSFTWRDALTFRKSDNACYFDMEYATEQFRTMHASIEKETGRALSLFVQQKKTLKNIIRECHIWEILEIQAFHSFGLKGANGRISMMQRRNHSPLMYPYMRIDKHAHEQGMLLHY